MAVLTDIIGLLLGAVLNLALIALIFYAPFWFFKKGLARYRTHGLNGLLPWVAPKVGDIALTAVSPLRSSFVAECDTRYEQARRAVRDIFRQEDPGPRAALMFEPDNWRAFCVEQWSVSGFDTPFVFVSPIAVQAMDVSRRRDACGFLDGLGEEAGGEWEPPERDMLPGSRFELRSIQAGAKCASPGIQIAMRASGKGNIGNPQTREELPCLCVRLYFFNRIDTIAAPPVDGKPEWQFDDVFFKETGVMDFAGEIPFTAQIVLFRGGDLSDYSNMTPLSNVTVGTINVTSPKIPL